MTSATPPPSLEAQWLHANRAAIVATYDPRERRRAQAALARTLRIARAQAASRRAPADIVTLAQRELRQGYRLSERVPPARRPWWYALWQWFADLWTRFTSALGKRVHLGAAGAVAIGNLVLVSVFGAFVLLAVRAFRSLQMDRERSRVSLEPLDTRAGAHTLLLAASTAARDAQYAHAVRLLFAAAVTLLDLRGMLRDDAAATVNELRTRLRARDRTLEDPFLEIARAFTAAAYAEHPIDHSSWERARAAYDLLVNGVAG